MSGEDQMKAIIRQAFALQNQADKGVLRADRVLAQVMKSIKGIIETLPEESLLRQKAFREMRPMIKELLEPYTEALEAGITREVGAGIPDMEAAAIREAKYAGATVGPVLGEATPTSVAAAVGRAKLGEKRFRELFMGQGQIKPWTQSMFRIVERQVNAGIVSGLTTQAIADGVVHELVTKGVPGVSLAGQTTARQIRQQAMTMSRTVVQDVNRQVKEEVWKANEGAMDGLKYQFTAGLDSRTCETCAILDGQRWDSRSDVPVTVTVPLHPNCRCTIVAVDPTDKYWENERLNGQQLSKKPYANGTHKSKVKVKGESFYRTMKPVKGSDYVDYLAGSNKQTQIEFFGGGKAGERRMRYFRNEMDRMDKDPRDILVSMLTGPTGAKRFIPVKDLIAIPKR
jgi:SPP1 gp7 family putative phage head morphogenesis protein